MPTPRRVLPGRSLAVQPCQLVCTWTSTGDHLTTDQGPLRLFGCSACGSEWVSTELWTPVDADGRVPVDVAAERRRTATAGSG